MSQGLDALTAKEKETLRLIVRGHDAKSAANALTLSVHTINERLRSARRKLDVTSSREAARLLLEAEANGSESLAYKQLGEASGELSRDRSASSTARRNDALSAGRNGAWWIGGGVVMSIVAIVLALSPAGPDIELRQDGEAPPEAITPIDAERERAARDWLTIVDTGEWQASYDAAARAFRDLNTVAGWAAASQQARVPLGAVTQRKAIEFQSVAAPPDGYAVVRFRTDFSSRKGAIESVTLARDDGVLKVVGYMID